MGGTSDDRKLHLRYAKQCDRVLRRSILLVIFVGAVFVLMAKFYEIVDEFIFSVMAFILGFGVPVLYYNISVAILYHRLMKELEGEDCSN